MSDLGLGPWENQRTEELYPNREDQHDTSKDTRGYVVAVVASAVTGEKGCHESILWGVSRSAAGPRGGSGRDGDGW